MKQPSEQEENIEGKALYELFKIFHEIDLNTKKGSPDEIALRSKGKNIKVKL